VQAAIIEGTLTERSDASLTYNLTNLFAGGELQVRSDNGARVAKLVIFGSGVPVVDCIESPMSKV
jgi:hypothetical protein